MSVNGITNATKNYDNKAAKAQSGQQAETKQKETENEAVVYQKKDQTVDSKKIYQRDTATINRLIAEAEERKHKLRDLVAKMLMKQGETYNDASDIYALLREGKLDVDAETKAQAQKDIAVDGYWGIEQTSDRLVSFAMALTGGDRSKADEMIDAVKKGYDAATKDWGGELPEISKQTLEVTISKLEAWRDGKDNESSTSDDTRQSAS